MKGTNSVLSITKEKKELLTRLKEENPHYIHFDCLGCGHSHSNEKNNLFCMEHSKQVKDNDLCEDFN